MTEYTRNIIDYAYNDNGYEFRKELYSAIHDKVSAHIESKKQEIAQGLIRTNEESDSITEGWGEPTTTPHGSTRISYKPETQSKTGMPDYSRLDALAKKPQPVAGSVKGSPVKPKELSDDEFKHHQKTQNQLQRDLELAHRKGLGGSKEIADITAKLRPIDRALEAHHAAVSQKR